MRARILATLIGLAALPHAPRPASAADFDYDLRMLGGFCMSASSERCYVRAFGSADLDGNGGLSLAVARETATRLETWATAHAEELAPQDRNGLLLGLVAIQVAGLENIFASYDADHDGEVTESELAADVRFDQRPVAELIRDRNAVDWERLLGRLGLASGLVRGLTPPADG